jgi:hypothetical protein
MDNDDEKQEDEKTNYQKAKEQIEEILGDDYSLIRNVLIAIAIGCLWYAGRWYLGW